MAPVVKTSLSNVSGVSSVPDRGARSHMLPSQKTITSNRSNLVANKGFKNGSCENLIKKKKQPRKFDFPLQGHLVNTDDHSNYQAKLR